MIDFLILYEHRAREYENICLLKIALENRGYVVEIEQVYQLPFLKYLRWKYKPKVILAFAMYDDETLAVNVHSFAWNVHKVVNLQWEQVFFKNSKLHTPHETAAEAVHICWGDECKTRLDKNHVRHAVVTGAIHLDFLRPAFLPYYSSKDTIKKQFNLPDGNMVLYISSFVQVKLREREVNLLRNRVGDGLISNFENALMSRKITLEWMDTLLKKDPNCYIVYRPHPGENFDSELQKRIDKGRFYVIPDLSVKQWILIADYIYTWISTAIVEAFFANKNCQILRPIPVSNEYDLPLFDDAKIIQSEDQFLLSYFNRDYPFPIKKEKIDHYYNIDSDFSFQRVVRILEEVYTSKKYDISHYPISLYFRAIAEIIIRIMMKAILVFNITSKTILLRKIPAISKYLDYFYYSQAKKSTEIVPKTEAEEIEKKLRSILMSVENDFK